MKLVSLLSVFLLSMLISRAQTEISKNPIVYAETFLGGSKGKAGGLTIGGGLNYQIKRSLISVRATGSLKLTSGIVMLSPITPFPVIREKSNSEEYAALYGLRFINRGQALKLSLGVSHIL